MRGAGKKCNVAILICCGMFHRKSETTHEVGVENTSRGSHVIHFRWGLKNSALC